MIIERHDCECGGPYWRVVIVDWGSGDPFWWCRNCFRTWYVEDDRA